MSTNNAPITGASRGLGLALARADDGWTLIINARGTHALEEARKQLAERTSVIAVPGDVTDAARRRALANAAADVGGLDLLVNNASNIGASPQPRLLDCPPDVLRAVFESKRLRAIGVASVKPKATILNISSDAAVEAYEGWGAYGASKAALEQMSHILAAEQPEWRVFWVDPSDMHTRISSVGSILRSISRPNGAISIAQRSVRPSGNRPGLATHTTMPRM
jgi:NAD(P)-dependent dehydrogenase (short-subunit alcohol dehydrogenase family)